MLPYEIKISSKQTLSISWAIVWRAIVIALPVSILGNFIPLLQAPLMAFITTPIIFWLATHWLLSGGRVGSQKIILMEQAHYQELIRTNSLKCAESETGSTS